MSTFKPGIFPGTLPGYSAEQADLMKERLVNIDMRAGQDDLDIESDPNTLLAPRGGPFLQMSPETPTGIPTTGFCMAVFPDPAVPMPFPVGGFTITPWLYMQNMASNNANVTTSPFYAKMEAVTAVEYGELLTSFAIDAGSIRFQITPTAGGNLGVVGRFIIAFTEL